MSDPQRYGDPLSPERQAELQALLDAARAPATEAEGETEAEGVARRPPFAGVRLSGADVAWLAAPLRNPDNRTVPDLHLEGADLRQAHLESADLRFAHLEGAEFWQAHLEGAYLYGARLEDASLDEAHLESAGFFKAHLEGARLLQAHLEHADLVEAHLEGARLNQARLAGADFTRAHLESRVYAADDPNLARVRAVNPAFPATLDPTDLRGALLDDATILRDASLSAAGSRTGPQVSDVHWSGASLGALDWTAFTRRGALLGDERAARGWRPRRYIESAAAKPEPTSDASVSQPPLVPDVPDDATASQASPAETQAQRDPNAVGTARSVGAESRRAFRRAQRKESGAAWARAMRANQQLARALRAQGLGDEADHFAYRAWVARRGVLRRRRAWLRWLAAGWLGFVAGHGYRFGRALALYVAVIATFTGLYLLASAETPPFDVISVSQSIHAPLAWYDALALSVSAFHGRGFFQLPLRADDLSALLAVIESFIGLFVELGVVAAFARRYLMDH